MVEEIKGSDGRERSAALPGHVEGGKRGILFLDIYCGIYADVNRTKKKSKSKKKEKL